jgi:hypothetical protein
LRSQAVVGPDRLHKRLALGEIRFDPLRFTLDIDSIAVDDPTHPMVALGHLHLKMAPLSVFGKPGTCPKWGSTGLPSMRSCGGTVRSIWPS